MIHPENYFNYFTEVEEYFVRKRGRSLLVSPLDWCLIELWRDSGIPLHIVLRGIDRSFDKTSKRRKREPKTLFYCHPAVTEAFEEYRQSRTGVQEEDETGEPREIEGDPVARERAARHVRDLRSQLRARPEEPYRRACRRLGDLAEELERPGLSMEDADRSLAAAGSQLARNLLDLLSKEERKQINKEVRKDLKIYKKRLSKEMYSQLERKYLERRVREDHGLPEFSLLELD